MKEYIHRLFVATTLALSLVLITGAPPQLLAGDDMSTDTDIDFPLVRTILITSEVSQPTHINHAGDGSGRLFITEKTGHIRILLDGDVLATPFLDISDRVSDYSECGLFSTAFPSDFSETGYFFVAYSYNTRDLGDLVPPDFDYEPNDGCDTVIARFKVTTDANVADAASETRVLMINQPYNNHNGGQIAFGPDGYLYIGTGDGGSGSDPHDFGQNTQSLLGKLLRIDVSAEDGYTVPADNPFVNNTDYRPEIWAFGLRNPWRFAFDRATDELYIADVGQSTREEVNVQPAASAGGENYGWRLMEGDLCHIPETGCETLNLTTPAIVYDHNQGCSITGGFVYRGDLYPELQGVYFYGDYCTRRLWGMQRNDDDRWETAEVGAISFAAISFGEDEVGNIYLAGTNDNIYLIGSDTAEVQVLLPLIRR